MIRTLPIGGLLLLLAGPARAESAPATEPAAPATLADAERAYQSVDFPATRSLAELALRAGGATRERTARLYVLLGISAAALGDVREAKRDFSIALAVEPELKLDKGLSPKLREPYLEAQGFLAATPERLELTGKPANDDKHLLVRLVDPQGLVSQLEVRLVLAGAAPTTLRLSPTALTRFELPAGSAERGYEFALRALDPYGNVVAERGSETDPEQVPPKSFARSRSRGPQDSAAEERSYLLPAVLAAAGAGALSVAVVFHVERERAAHEWNGPACENPGGRTRLQQCQAVDSRIQSNERWAVGFYAAGGALLTGSLIALFTGSPRETAPSRSGLLGCSVVGTGLACNGRF